MVAVSGTFKRVNHAIKQRAGALPGCTVSLDALCSGEDDTMAKPVSEEEIKSGGVAVDRLRSLVERIERLEEERKALGSDIKDIYAEAKSAGFDIKVLRQLIRIRKQEAAEVEEQETMLDIYRRALGM
jgi:uncharacterized protein (UPF0335 family)